MVRRPRLAVELPGIGYSGHKQQKGDKELTIVANHGFVLGPISINPVTQQDTIILPATLTAFVEFTRRVGIDLCGSSLTLDAGFDSQANKDAIKAHKMKPVIYPNRRNTKTPIAIARKFRWFARARCLAIQRSAPLYSGGDRGASITASATFGHSASPDTVTY